MKDKKSKNLGRLFKEIRIGRMLSQEEVAKRLGLQQSAIARIESGQRAISFLEMVEFCKLTKMGNLAIKYFYGDLL